MHPLHRRRFVLATIAAAAAGALAACGGGGDDEDDVTPARSLSLSTYGDGSRSILQAGRGWRAENIAEAGVLKEVLVTGPAGMSRAFYAADGRVQALRLASGASARIAYPRAGRVDVVGTGADGAVQWALALYEQDGRLMAAPLGAALANLQINAALAGAVQGALTVNADPTDLLAGIDTARATEVPANLVSLLFADAMSNAPERLKALVQTQSTPGQQIAAGLLQAGVLAPVLTLVGLNLGTVLAGTAAAGALASVGSLLLVGAAGYALYTGINNIRNGAARALMNDSLDAISDDSATESSLLDRLRSAVDSMAANGQAIAEKALDVVRSTGAAGDTLAAEAGIGSLPALSGTLDAVTSRVRGVLVDTTGRLFTGAGMLDADGTLNLGLAASDGTQAQIAARRDADVLSGSYRIGDQTGSVSGQQSQVGACNASSSSGGAGTYSYAYNVGTSNGSFPFDYQMYSIPDQARIIDIGGRELFNTGQLVSGSQSVAVPLQGESNVVVLINAPRSGTAWDFVIGCGR